MEDVDSINETKDAFFQILKNKKTESFICFQSLNCFVNIREGLRMPNPVFAERHLRSFPTIREGIEPLPYKNSPQFCALHFI